MEALDAIGLRAVAGLLFGLFGILFWIGGLVAVDWYLERIVDDDRYE
ncbi:MAG: hypothetical protein ACLFMT_03810 [Halobacteriales archaeon]